MFWQVKTGLARLSVINTEMPSDPLLALLQSYQAQLDAFDPPNGLDCVSLAQDTWVRTRNQIIYLKPAATTAAGAVSALDHVVQSKDLFDESADLQMLWYLVLAARDCFVGQSLAKSDLKSLPPAVPTPL
jgi:hypothetical protein